jgi:hypothetical protein
MAESPEELKARIAELEKQLRGRKSGNLEFRVGEKGGVSVRSGSLPGDPLSRTVDQTAG